VVLTPRVNLFFSQDEYREMEKRAAQQGQPSVYAYLKDLALKQLEESS